MMCNYIKLHIIMNCLPTFCWNIFWLNTSRNFLDANLHNIKTGYNLAFSWKSVFNTAHLLIKHVGGKYCILFTSQLNPKSFNHCKNQSKTSSNHRYSCRVMHWYNGLKGLGLTTSIKQFKEWTGALIYSSAKHNINITPSCAVFFWYMSSLQW